MPQKNQHKPCPPDEDIRQPLEEYFKLGCSDVETTELLKFHYDTASYGLSVITIRRLRKKWGLQSTRQQKHTLESIHDQVREIREQFPLRGAEAIRKALRSTHDIRAPRELVSRLLHIVEPEKVIERRRRGFKRRRFWAAGVNDVWPQDQHDKWGRFGLWLHAGLEAFSGKINWMKVWWTNKNPRLVAKFYLDTCRRIGGIPIITQSDPGTENYGVANAHTMIRHRLDPNLANTLQHRFARGHNNILSEIKWSVFRRDFSPGFEDILEQGVQNGWYDVDNTLENLLFRWLAIPWLQDEIDNWVRFKNTTAPRAVKNKILPHGIPALIRSRPSHFNAFDFKIHVTPELLDEAEALYAPQDHPVFRLVPFAFHDRVSSLYAGIGQPDIKAKTFWDIYLNLLKQLRDGSDAALTDILTHHQHQQQLQNGLAEPGDDMPLLPDMEPFRLGQPLDVGRNINYIGGVDVSALPSDVPAPCPEFADFSTDEESDDSELSA